MAWTLPSRLVARLRCWKTRHGCAGQSLNQCLAVADRMRRGSSTRRWYALKSKWLTWTPASRTVDKTANHQATKPTEPGFDGFDGSSSAPLAEIGTTPSEPNRFSTPGPCRQKSITVAVDSPTATERGMSWAEWKAAALNQLFLELGRTGQPGRITADTIRHGEQAWMTSWKNRDAESQKSLRPD